MRLVEFLHPTLRDAAAKDGAPVLLWLAEKQATATTEALRLVEFLHPTLRDEAAKDGAPVLLWL